MDMLAVFIPILVLIGLVYFIVRPAYIKGKINTYKELFSKVAGKLKLQVNDDWTNYPMIYPVITGEIDGCKICLRGKLKRPG